MNRLDFLGLNANQSACVLLYVIAAVWVLNFATKRVYARIILIVIEIVLLVAFGATMSRGGVVVLVCAAVFMRYLYKRWGLVGGWRRREVLPAGELVSSQAMPALLKKVMGRMPMPRSGDIGWKPMLRWVSHSPLWRVALVLCNPGLWGRATPGYIVLDASIGNRFELWKGGLKLIATSPLGGWGFDNTGTAYMNWFQSVDNHTYYRGMVNSFLQLTVAYGLPVLFGVLFVSLLAMLGAMRILPSQGLPARGLDHFDWNSKKSIALLCFLWLVIWGVSSCFSTMLSSLMLFAPPVLAILVMLALHPPQMTELRGALVVSLSVCLLIFIAGRVFARGDPVTIKRDINGLVSVVVNTAGDFKSGPGKTCVIYIDQQALGAHYGKAVRKFVADSNLEKCVVLDRLGYLNALHENTDEVDLVILSGNTADWVVAKEGKRARFVLLNPAFLPRDIPGGAIQTILYPEVNWTHSLEPDLDVLEKFRAKIRVVPFNECFETSWPGYLIL